MVTYAEHGQVDAARALELGDDPHGALSRRRWPRRWRGAADLLGADLAVGITGIAGPDGGTAEKPVGTVWFAFSVRAWIAAPAGFPGTRDEVRARAVQAALVGAYRRLLDESTGSIIGVCHSGIAPGHVGCVPLRDLVSGFAAHATMSQPDAQPSDARLEPEAEVPVLEPEDGRWTSGPPGRRSPRSKRRRRWPTRRIASSGSRPSTRTIAGAPPRRRRSRSIVARRRWSARSSMSSTTSIGLAAADATTVTTTRFVPRST